MWKCAFLSAAASATSSPAMLGIKEHRDSVRDYQRVQSTMQFYNYQGDNNIHKSQYTGTQQCMHLKAMCTHMKANPLSSPDCRLPSGPFCPHCFIPQNAPSRFHCHSHLPAKTALSYYLHQSLPTQTQSVSLFHSTLKLVWCWEWSAQE